jgi:hypothetical protein
MGKRQPKIAALWLGAIVLGMESHILRQVSAGMFAVNMLTAAWTCTAHSFIGPRKVIPSDCHNAKIRRSGECRLLYLAEAEDHARVPVCPREPFGDTDLSETDVEVRAHAHCRGQHCLQYEDWTWDLQMVDEVLRIAGSSPTQISPTRMTAHAHHRSNFARIEMACC